MSLTFGNQVTETQKWEYIRSLRDKYLTASDWSMLPDVKVSKPYWENYRQALRDIPQRYAKPEDVVWPQEPQ